MDNLFNIDNKFFRTLGLFLPECIMARCQSPDFYHRGIDNRTI